MRVYFFFSNLRDSLLESIAYDSFQFEYVAKCTRHTRILSERSSSVFCFTYSDPVRLESTGTRARAK